MNEAPRIDDPKYWTARAAETRSMAEGMRDVEAKRILRDIAASYERLAEIARARLRYIISGR